MSVLPSPVPHPLEFSPFDVPGWAYEALEWVVGFDWPAGNEVATWDVADRWFALTTSLIEPNDAAMSAANKFLSGYGGEGITAEGFSDAWHLVAGDENAPLHDLLRVSGELGKLVEGCGSDIEAAKLEAWIEIGIFLIELVGMAVTVALTLGAASPAAGGLIVATRLAIQRIFRRLVEQLGTKALKQTAGRAVKQVTTREGLRKLGREALDEGFDEAREEFATNGGIQAYQQSTGRSDGFDLNDLGRSTAAGFAGGAASSGAQVGSHGQGGVMRGAGGEVLAEFGAAATFGELPDAAGVAKSATSGAAGSALHAMPAAIDLGGLDLSRLDGGLASPALPTVAVGGSLQAFGGTPADAGVTSGVALGDGPATSPGASTTAGQGPSLFTPADAGPSSSAPSAPSPPLPSSLPDSPLPGASLPGASLPNASLPDSPLPDSPLPSASQPDASLPGASQPGPSLPDAPTLVASTGTLDLAGPAAAPSPSTATPSPVTPSPVTPSPVASPSGPTGGGPFLGPNFSVFPRPTGKPTPGAAHRSAPSTRRGTLSDLDRIADALGPRPLPRPRTVARPAKSRPAPPTPEIRDERAYFGYVEHARQTHERTRRDEYANYLRAIAEENRAKILDLGRRADEANRAGYTLRGSQYRHQAFELSEIVTEIEDQIGRVRSGELAPDRVEVDPPAWARINQDVGNLAPGGVRSGDRSTLDGFAGRPPIDRTRHYNVVGGLRAPLAVHQVDLENAVPRNREGQVSRLPDPRQGSWFRLANDGGPSADPTRGLNCVDGVLALFDTYIHGRPRVSAPRTFDVYAHGNPDRPLGGEIEGLQRIRLATGGDFQNLCPYLGEADPTEARPAMDVAVRNLTNHLLNTGHGAYAFLVTDLEGGGSHSWAAVNQQGTVLFLDPQISRVSEHTPMYRHHGVPAPTNIVSLEALVVDASGTPVPLPHHGPGNWSADPPTGSPDETPTSAADRLAVQSLTPAQRTALDGSLVEAEAKAVEVSADLHRVAAGLEGFTADDRPRIVDEHHRVKQLGSLARKVLARVETEGTSTHDAIKMIKDRVRFSVQVPAQRYGESVIAVLNQLENLGYRGTEMESFWAGHGRHNGLNINLTGPDGFVLEIQFPTQPSLDVGHETHVHYEDVRREDLAPEERVEAFLRILQINKLSGIYRDPPRGLELLDDFLPDLRHIDTSLAVWLRKKRLVLRAYKRYLVSSGTSFEDVLRRHDLGPEDVPGIAELGLFGD